ncbi:hypothetical protein GCM10027575_34000 [Phytohabitans suffuscus]
MERPDAARLSQPDRLGTRQGQWRRGYTKAIRRARRLIYLEDQYLWSREVADLLSGALACDPDLRLVAVVPRYPDVDGELARPNQVGRAKALDVCRGARRRPRARLRRGEPRGRTRVRARQGLRRRRRVGVRRQRQLQPSLVDP